MMKGVMNMQQKIIGTHTVTDAPVQSAYALHAHGYYEILLYLSGEADYSVEGRRYRLHPGDLMLMRCGEAHHLVLRSPARYERICIHFEAELLKKVDPALRLLEMFNSRPLGTRNQYRADRFPDQKWQFYMEKVTKAQDDLHRLCWLLPLLEELGACFAQLREDQTAPDGAAAVMTYINGHLSEPLSLDSLCARFHYSKTYLNDLFRRAAGTTVWQYIVTKRLLAARQRLQAGEMPTKVAQLCGFQDYSTFYRAYRQHFGVSPKEDARK